MMDATPEIKLLVALGNPGARYANTRHNAGWMIADMLLRESRPQPIHALWQPDNGELFWLTLAGRSCLLLKPLTFMNESGAAVAKVHDHFALAPREMLALSDDLDLPSGTLRLRRNGSNGGHRGLGSIIQHLQSSDFPRLRAGIGRPQPGSGTSIIDFVLAPWASADTELPLQQARQVLALALDGRFEAACSLAAQPANGGHVHATP